MRWMWCLMAAAVVLWGGAGARAADTRSSTQEFRERYSVVSERNIFLKNRYRPPTYRSGPSAPPPPRVPEQSLVLRGVVYENDEHRAYIEDLDRRTLLKLRAGEAVARGKIVAIEIDAVAYEYAGQTRWIGLGCNLMGAAGGASGSPFTVARGTGGPGTALSTSTSASPSTQPASESALQPASESPMPDPNDPNLSMEEKLKLRRMQELNRR